MQKTTEVVVSVVMGSDSDLPIMEETVKVLVDFAIPHELFRPPPTGRRSGRLSTPAG